MTEKTWNPKNALRQAVPFFHALPHLSQARLTTCGNQSVSIAFDSATCELVAFDDDGNEIARTPFEPAE